MSLSLERESLLSVLADEGRRGTNQGYSHLLRRW